MRTLFFHPDYIRSLMKDKDVYDYQLDTNCSITARIDQASLVLNSVQYQIDAPTLKKKGPTYIYHPSRWEDKVYLRHVTKRLRLIYRIRVPDRNTIIKQVCHILNSDAPLNILRTDIEKFYRNVSIDSLICKINRDGFLRHHEIQAITILLSGSQNSITRGLPWGLSISSALAEIAMGEFDQSLLSIEGLFYYRRFVDDIIAFSPVCTNRILPSVKRVLPTPLKLGEDKTKEIVEFVDGSTNNFEYLGYGFKRSISKRKSKREVKLQVGIAPSKIDRMKKRIDLTIAKFCKDGNWEDLRGRIRMLTGNYHIKRSNHANPIPVGIYYNYRFITDTNDLITLDSYLKKNLISLRIHLRKKGKDIKRIKILFGLSFLIGYKNRIFHRFSESKIKRYRQAWSHE